MFSRLASVRVRSIKEAKSDSLRAATTAALATAERLSFAELIFATYHLFRPLVRASRGGQLCGKVSTDETGLASRSLWSSICAPMARGRRNPLPGISDLPGVSELAGLARHIELRAVSRWVGLGLVVGLLSGLGACALYVGFEAVRHLIVHELAHTRLLEPAGEPSLFRQDGLEPEGTGRRWILVIAPAIGAFLAAWIVDRFCKEAAGGNEGWLQAFHNGRGRIRRRVIPTKLLASAINLGAGASAGREGPIAHIGAAFGAMVGRFLRLSDRERRLLLIAGAAGGIGAIFRTPFGGALFVVEVLYRDDFEAEALVPAVLSSVVAYSFFTSIFGEGELFATVQNYRLDARELPLFVLMAICCGIVGVLFTALHHRLAEIQAKIRVWVPLRALGAGLLVGLLSLIHPSALGTGYGWMQQALEPTGLIEPGWSGVRTMLLIAAIKVLATSISTTSGASGGVFGPSVVIGGMVGGAFGMAFHEIVPEVATEPSSYMLVGMACFVAGVTNCPISTLVMASEMTGSYELLVPTMLAQVVTYALTQRVQLYVEQVPTRRDSPAHGGEYVLDVLQDLNVKDVFVESEVTVVQRSLPLAQLLRQASECSQVVFPVAGDDGQIEGIVTLDTIKAYLYDEDLGMLAIAADCESPLVSVTRTDSLALALERMALSHYQQLPVIDPDHERVLGFISYDDLLQAYSRELSTRRGTGVEGQGEELA